MFLVKAEMAKRITKGYNVVVGYQKFTNLFIQGFCLFLNNMLVVTVCKMNFLIRLVLCCMLLWLSYLPVVVCSPVPMVEVYPTILTNLKDSLQSLQVI